MGSSSLRPSMVGYGVEYQLPAIVGITIVREAGPVTAVMIFAGKIGSSIGAEPDSMKVKEQIDAMEVSGTNPFKYLAVTRVLAATFKLPVLVMPGDAISLYESYPGVNIRGLTSFKLFWTQVFDNLSFGDVLPTFIKATSLALQWGSSDVLKDTTAAKALRVWWFHLL